MVIFGEIWTSLGILVRVSTYVFSVQSGGDHE